MGRREALLWGGERCYYGAAGGATVERRGVDACGSLIALYAAWRPRVTSRSNLRSAKRWTASEAPLSILKRSQTIFFECSWDT